MQKLTNGKLYYGWVVVGGVRRTARRGAGHTSRESGVYWYGPRSPAKTYSNVSRPPYARSGAAWSPTSSTSAANWSPPWPKSSGKGRRNVTLFGL